MEQKLTVTEKLKYIRKSCEDFDKLYDNIFGQSKLDMFDKFGKRRGSKSVSIGELSLFFTTAKELKIRKNTSKTITECYNQIIIYNEYISEIMEEINKKYGDKDIKYFAISNTERISLKGIKLTDFIKRDTYKTEKYNNPVIMKEGNVSPQLLGTAVQTYYDIKNNKFEPLRLVDYVAEWYNLAEEYNYYNDFKDMKDNKLIDFSILYADLVAHSRTCHIFDYFNVDDITTNDRYNIRQLVKNIDKFMKKKNFKIEYSEVAFNYSQENKIRRISSIDNTTEDFFLNNKVYGDLDFITDKNTILDIKCCKRNAPVQALSQQLIYYLMGRLGINTEGVQKSYFKSIHEVGYYNPLLDNYVYINLDELGNKTLLQFLNRVMNYPLSDRVKGIGDKYERIINMICKEDFKRSEL